MKDNPLGLICIFFSLGIWAVAFSHIPLLLVCAGLFLFLLLAARNLQNNLLFTLFLAAAMFCLGALHLKNFQTYPAGHILNFISDTPQEVYLRGEVVSAPEISQTFYQSSKTTFTLRPSELKIKDKWQAVQGLIQANVYGPRTVHYGDELLLQGALTKPQWLRNPGGFNQRAYLANQNIYAILQVKENYIFKAISSAQRFPLRQGILKFKQHLQQIIFTGLEGEQASLLTAILLGVRSGISQDIKDLFINTGTIHILAISGLHVGLIALIVIALLKFLRLGRALSYSSVIVFLIGYAFLSGGRPSVIRATVMAVAVLLGLLLNREIKIYNSLGLAALVLLIFNPRFLFDPGFQLSFASVIAIAAFAPKIKGPRALAVSLAAWIGVAPIVTWHFNIVSPIAIAANLIIVPWLFLIVSTGIAFLIFSLIWASLGAIFAQAAGFTLSALTKIAAFFAKIPFGFFHQPRPSVPFFIIYYALLLLIFNRRRWKLSMGKVGIALALAANLLVWQPLFKAPSDKLIVTFLDVGRADAMFIEFPNSGGTMLIDSGDLIDETDAARLVLLPFLWNKGISKIDAVVLTHAHADHVGGMGSLLKEIKANYIFDNGEPLDSLSYRCYQAEIKEKRIPYRALRQGEKIIGFKQAQLQVLNPPEVLWQGTPTDINNNSLVLKLTYQKVSFLLCGDIEEEAINGLLTYRPSLAADVIKIPHHGSDEGQNQELFLRAVSPRAAIISITKNDRWGLPAPGLIKRLEVLGAKVYTTGKSGAIMISTDGQGIEVKTMADTLR